MRLIGIAGETASGKSTLCARLLDQVPVGSMAILGLDSYYLSQEHLTVAERGHVNFDHPDAFDIPLLITHIDRLLHGQSIQIPVYDFASHARVSEVTEVPWAPIVVVEGILALYWEDLRRRFNFAVYVAASESVRLERRLARDIAQRGRTRESVIDQWNSSVQKSSAEFCVPTKRFADLVVDGEATGDTQFERLLSLLTDVRCEHSS